MSDKKLNIDEIVREIRRTSAEERPKMRGNGGSDEVLQLHARARESADIAERLIVTGPVIEEAPDRNAVAQRLVTLCKRVIRKLTWFLTLWQKRTFTQLNEGDRAMLEAQRRMAGRLDELETAVAALQKELSTLREENAALKAEAESAKRDIGENAKVP